eukprot:10156277-Alexandrium_andersonii.AAC.1
MWRTRPPISTVRPRSTFANTFHDDCHTSKLAGPGTSTVLKEPSLCKTKLLNFSIFRKRELKGVKRAKSAQGVSLSSMTLARTAEIWSGVGSASTSGGPPFTSLSAKSNASSRPWRAPGSRHRWSGPGRETA